MIRRFYETKIELQNIEYRIMNTNIEGKQITSDSKLKFDIQYSYFRTFTEGPHRRP